MPQRAIDCGRPGRNLWRVKDSPNEAQAPGPKANATPPEAPTSKDGIDLLLLEESLAKTVWERMLANDDALRLADLLHGAMVKTRAKP